MSILSKTIGAVAGLGLAVAGTLAHAETVKGQVTKVDPARNMVTIKHGGIPSLDQPAMAFAFQADAAAIKGLNEGDTVTFTPEKVNNRFVAANLKKGG
ncbi:copper-binding protein [Amphibiibacter pelophylacis]|uniref:Copper-binding protein n=1 Tax=Amphibiibacter pelophylacis TaxID=1799477 RepID=A0ACC6P1L5_9BURK